TFARRQRVDPGEDDPARTCTSGAELGFCLPGEPSGTGAVGRVECLAEQLTRLAAPVAPPQQRAEVGEGARSLQPRVAVLEGVDGLPEQGRSTLAAGRDTCGSFRHAQRARGAERPG